MLSSGPIQRVPEVLGATRGVTVARRGAEKVVGALATKTAPELKTKKRRRRIPQPGRDRVIPRAPLGPTDGLGGRNGPGEELTGQEDEGGKISRFCSNSNSTRSCESKTELG